MTTLPPNFPPDLRKALGIDAMRPVSSCAPITAEIRAALEQSRLTRGQSH